MDECGQGSREPGGAQERAAAETSFIPFGARCPGCGYALEGCAPGSCPECGAVTSDLAQAGQVRPMHALERERAERAALKAPVRAVIAHALSGMNSLSGSLFLVALLGFVVFPLLRDVDRMRDPWMQAARAGFRGGLLFAALVAVQIGFSWWSFARARRRREAALRLDLPGGLVEECHAEVTHAMRTPADDGEWLLLRLRGGHTVRLTAAAARDYGLIGKPSDPAGALVRRVMQLSVLPRSKLVVGVTFTGEPVPEPRRADLRPRRWYAEAGEPVVWVTRLERVVSTRRASAPPFAPQGAQHGGPERPPQAVRSSPGPND